MRADVDLLEQRLIPGSPLFDTPMPIAAATASIHWAVEKSGSTSGQGEHRGMGPVARNPPPRR